MLDNFNKYNLKKDWQNSIPRLTDKELLEAFPEAKNIISTKIAEWELAKKKVEKEISEFFDRIYALETDSYSEFFAEEFARVFLLPELDNCIANIARLKRFETLTNPDNRQINDFQKKLERARSYPIYDIASQKLDLKRSGSKFAALCPFHNEKTPSFYLYPETNSFYCFGCQKHGDVIELTMQLYGANFIDAIKILQN